MQLTALSQALKVNLKIAYLDGRSQDGRVEFVSFNYASDENETPLTLIYRWAIDLSWSRIGLIDTILGCTVGPDTMTY